MAIGSKIISRITKTTASSTHTANAIRAQTNGGFSLRSKDGARPIASASGRTISGYEHSILGRSRSRQAKALDASQSEQARQRREERFGSRHLGTDRTTRPERGAIGNRFRDAQTSGVANVGARPTPRPTFRRPK